MKTSESIKRDVFKFVFCSHIKATEAGRLKSIISVIITDLVRNRVQGAESTCCTDAARPESSWHHRGRCALAAGSPPVLRGLTSTCCHLRHHQSARLTVSLLTWAAVLPVHYEHSRGFVCGEEKSYLSKTDVKSPPCPVSQCQERFWVKS